MTTPQQVPPGDPADEDEVGTVETEPEVFTAADRNALKKALAAERKAHRDAAAKLTQLESERATDGDKAWMDKLAKTTSDSNAKFAKFAARTALASAGLQGKPDRLVGLLDLSAVTVDDEGEVSGLSDQIVALQQEYPSLFQSPEASNGDSERVSIGRLNTGDRKPLKVNKSYLDKMNEQLGISN